MERRGDVVMTKTVIPGSGRRGQGCETGSSVGSDGLSRERCVVVDNIQNMRLNLADLPVDCGDLGGVRGVDAGDKRGFIAQQTYKLLNVL